MPLSKFWPSRRPRVPPNAATSSRSAMIATIAPNDPPNPPIPQLSELPQQPFPDYIHSGASGPRWDAALGLPSLLTDIRTLPSSLVGPLSQVTDVLSSTVEAVKLMRENQEECAHLVSRTVRYLRSLIDSMRTNNVSFADGTPTAASLIALKRYIFHLRCTSSTLKSPFWG
jgi:hypothetical protein